MNRLFHRHELWSILSAIVCLSGCGSGDGDATGFSGTAAPVPAVPADVLQAAQREGAKNLGRDVVETNSIGMKMVFIPAGEFMMGSPPSEEYRSSLSKQTEERPRHRVRITRPFYLGRCEVTQAEYLTITGKSPSEFAGEKNLKDYPDVVNTDKFPVENVSWDDAVKFCTELGLRENKIYRLPTEAEWEYACRAGTITAFSFGDKVLDTQICCDPKWSRLSSQVGKFWGRPRDVGSYSPNALGLHDMHGNISEWCQDWYDDRYYAMSVVDDPQGPSSRSSRVIRGGDWVSEFPFCRSAWRRSRMPDDHNLVIGFRVVCELDPPNPWQDKR